MFRYKRLAVVAILLSSLVACSYQVATPVAPAYDLVTAFDEPIPGKFSIFVDSSGLSSNVKVDGYNCSAHTFPFDASYSFEQSVFKTIEQIVSELESIPSPVTRVQMAARGDAGFIHVRSQGMTVDLGLNEGFWSADFEAEVEMSATLSVDDLTGRLLGGTVSGRGKGRADAGSACGGGARAIAEAAQGALKELSRNLGERMANSEKIRVAAAEASARPAKLLNVAIGPAVSTIKAPATEYALLETRCARFSGDAVAHHACRAGAGLVSDRDAAGFAAPEVAPAKQPPPGGTDAQAMRAVHRAEQQAQNADFQSAKVVDRDLDEQAQCETVRPRNPSLWALCRSVAGPDRARIVPASGLDAPLGARLACQPYASAPDLYGPCLARNASRTLDSFH